MKSVYIKSMIAPLMREPKANSERVDEVLHGMMIFLLEEIGDWYYISTEYNYNGYIHRKDIYDMGNRDMKLSKCKKAYLYQSFADIMSEPNIKSPVITSITRGSILYTTGKLYEKGYVGVRLGNGEEGYIKESYLINYEQTINSSEQLRMQLVHTACSYLGSPYRWGGKSLCGIDCSGLCQMAYMLNGITIFRDSRIHPEFIVKSIPQEDKKPGDLLYFPGHIAMYIGEERYVHATAKEGSDGVVINSLSPTQPNYRKDLANSLYAVGSIFYE